MLDQITIQFSENIKKSPIKDKVGELVVKVVNFEEEIETISNELIDLKLMITNDINKLENKTYAKVLQLRYVELLSFHDISLELRYSKAYIHRIYVLALIEFSQIRKETLGDASILVGDSQGCYNSIIKNISSS